MSGAGDLDDLGRCRDHRRGGTHLGQRAERVRRSVGEHRRHCDPRQVLGTDAFRLSRRMDRIGEQRQHVDRCLPGRHHHGRLPTAVGMSPGDQRTLGKAAAQLDRFDDAGTVA